MQSGRYERQHDRVGQLMMRVGISCEFSYVWRCCRRLGQDDKCMADDLRQNSAFKMSDKFKRASVLHRERV